MLYLLVRVIFRAYYCLAHFPDGIPVEMFKVRMQGQYGAATDKRLRVVVSDMWKDWGFRKGIMRGYWVTFAREIPAYAGCAFVVQSEREVR